MNQLLNFKSFFKFLNRNKMYTLIEVFGFSVSLMFVILIAAYSIQEFSTDTFHEKADRIYMLGDENYLMSTYDIASRLKERYPEVEDAITVTSCLFITGSETMPISAEARMMNASVQFANNNFFTFFSFDLLTGDKQQVLAAKNNAVISQSFAHKLFPGEAPLGKTIRLMDSVSVTVTGVMKDIRNSTILYSDIILSIDNLRSFREDMDGNTFHNATCTNVFLLEKEGSSLASRAEDVRDYFKDLYWYYKRELAKEVVFVPLTKVYFSDYKTSIANRGDKKLVMILLSVGILILLFAIINYINLTVAQTGFRAKEMATRRLLGSSRFDLFNRLILESTLLTFISFGIGLLLAIACVPYANELLNTKISFAGLLTPGNILIALLVIVSTGFVTGLLPATLISRTKAVDVVKGAFRQMTKMVFSKFFITFQNAITISLIAASIVMVTQVNHLIKAPLGYNATNVIDVPIMDITNRSLPPQLVAELKNQASVHRVSLSAGTPYNGGNNQTVEFENRSIGFQVIVCDSALIPMLDIEIIRDNQVSSDDAYYLSEEALKEENLSIDATTFNYYGRDLPVAGVIKDFQLVNVLRGKEPILIQIKKTGEFYPWNMLVEVQGDPYAAYQEVKQVYEQITHQEFTGKFVDQQVAESFEKQQRAAQIVSLFSIVAVILSFLGLLAMSTYFIQQRSREIAVRKVFGSESIQVMIRLIRTFLIYVLVAFVIATPLVWYGMERWLSDYAYRISLSPWMFLTSGLLCLLISFITVFWQSYMAANANPVESIKSE